MQEQPLHAHRPQDLPRGPHGGRPDWDAVYAGRPRWDIGRPQPAFLALAEAGAITGRVLDVGCGTGEHVLMCAGLGLEATGVDVAAAAIAAAERKAHERELTARFCRQDVTRLASLGETFDTVLDSGLLVHVIDDPEVRTAYLAGLRAAVPAGGRYFLLCFRDPRSDPRARHLTPQEIATCFADGWHLDTAAETTLDSRIDPGGIPAWLATLTRI
ncbi:class I SAM-dependent methyltransferase [Streptomyces cocklensis]|jgi:SAM-dependent methyltransferase|uniref:Methyltransferase domain-containing protein n=1 Tax=Actinacidiphila cocklensis TaxID=887465 RepID=A0A9W4GXD6_9ACTN|nr:class I SAM-dependent methyltransferase [Actinacidiphila cocklensis]MDD1064197.1 class I SAM-dependent methyltransferase [Actinacidiphila cocklensis]WSX75521.1 class I SAM-dependent methyltransferase [Streptomyces sp. NBC_00899]CAG6398650.1 Methyltransferase domain-containing protein [Actinacidiphila cocklensis]